MAKALLSVSDKSGIVEFATWLVTQGYELISSGGTFKTLNQAGLPVEEVSAYTGFEEIMGGRVKTLHPKIHGGILGRRDEDEAVMAREGIQAIDIVCVNLYPFAATIAREDVTLQMAIENIDIGGPAMIRAAAKNHQWVSVLVNPKDYAQFQNHAASNNGTITHDYRAQLAQKAFEHTGGYDQLIADYLLQQTPPSQETPLFPETMNIQVKKIQNLRYGENAHQRAAFYQWPHASQHSLAHAELVQGKPMSYNNIADSDAALACVRTFDVPACVIVKHANPCGAAVGTHALEAYEKAYSTDPMAAFGGIIAFNQVLTEVLCEKIIGQQFVEVIIAPNADADAIQLLTTKPNIRLLLTHDHQMTGQAQRLHYKSVDGGLLIQQEDTSELYKLEQEVVTERQPTEQEWIDLKFAWNLCQFVKSNAIVYAKDGKSIGIGAGQMSRVFAAEIGALKAQQSNLSLQGTALASDAFFPFRDGIDMAAQAGVSCIIQPGGSLRDNEVIQAANEAKISMVFTGVRHFRH